MEVPDVEVFTQRFGGPRPEFQELQFPHLVRQRLTGPGDVAIDLGAHVLQRQRRIVRQVLQRLVPCPALVVHAGIHHQPHGAPHFVAQAPEVIVGRFVDVHFDGEFLAVQPPSLSEGVRVEGLAELRQLALLLCQ